MELSRRTINMINKVKKDTDRHDEGKIIVKHTDDITKNYCLMRGFNNYKGEILFELVYPNNFGNEHPLRIRALTPNGILEKDHFICVEIGEYHSGGSQFQAHRILYGAGLLRYIWEMIQNIVAERKPKHNFTGIGWVTKSNIKWDKIDDYAEKSIEWNLINYSKFYE